MWYDWRCWPIRYQDMWRRLLLFHSAYGQLGNQFLGWPRRLIWRTCFTLRMLRIPCKSIILFENYQKSLNSHFTTLWFIALISWVSRRAGTSPTLFYFQVDNQYFGQFLRLFWWFSNTVLKWWYFSTISLNDFHCRSVNRMVKVRWQ